MPDLMEGIEVSEEELFGCHVTTTNVQSEQAAEQLDRMIGQYITIETPVALDKIMEISEVGECLATVLDRVLCPYYQGKLCICGMGAHSVPADSLGPEVICNLPLKLFSEYGIQGNFRDVCAFAPGTEMMNNVNTEIVAGGVIKAVDADCLLLVDSSMTNNTSRLFRTFQLSTAGGINPYLAGRKGRWSELGIPVISLGVPTTIPLSILCPQKEQEDKTMLTDVHVQDVIITASIIIAYAILRVCWPEMSQAECYFFARNSRNPISYGAPSDESNINSLLDLIGR